MVIETMCWGRGQVFFALFTFQFGLVIDLGIDFGYFVQRCNWCWLRFCSWFWLRFCNWNRVHVCNGTSNGQQNLEIVLKIILLIISIICSLSCSMLTNKSATHEFQRSHFYFLLIISLGLSKFTRYFRFVLRTNKSQLMIERSCNAFLYKFDHRHQIQRVNKHYYVFQYIVGRFNCLSEQTTTELRVYVTKWITVSTNIKHNNKNTTRWKRTHLGFFPSCFICTTFKHLSALGYF